MTIIDRLREMVPDDEQICDVVVGIFWTYVRTQYGVAVSATAHRWVEDPPGAIIPWAGELIGKRVRDVADLYASESLTARSLANAAIWMPAESVMRVPDGFQFLLSHHGLPDVPLPAT